MDSVLIFLQVLECMKTARCKRTNLLYMNICKCEHSVPADILKIHTRHFNFKGMELQTARESSYLYYCDACMQLKLCVFHDESVRLMEFVILLSPLLPHIGVVLWLAPDRPTFRQPNLLQSPHV